MADREHRTGIPSTARRRSCRDYYPDRTRGRALGRADETHLDAWRPRIRAVAWTQFTEIVGRGL